MFKKALLIILFFTSMYAIGQTDYYSSPVKIPMLLSGSFAELRSNHFHSGIDIKTQGAIGQPIYSVADGFISRIVVSPGGYGKALYINHPNGTTTVYGHLNSFREDIANFVKTKQYLNKSFKVDLQVPPGTFPIKKEEIIAKSGNSGSSDGPHLHFEIRDTKSEEPLNPLKYNFDIKDNTPPKVFSLMIIPLSDSAHVKFDNRKRRFPIVYDNGKYQIRNNPIIPVSGKIGFAVEANDFFDETHNKCGIYSMQMTIDDELYYSHQLDRFSFNESRYINSHIEYETYIEFKRRFQKTWVDPGNMLSSYNYLKGDGSLNLTEDNIHQIRIFLKDSYGNTSILEFNVEYKPYTILDYKKSFEKKFEYNTKNKFHSDNIKFDIPEGALYKSINFEYNELPDSNGLYSNIHSIHKNITPLHKSASVKIRTFHLPDSLKPKALLVRIDDETGEYYASGGKYEKGWISSKIRSFGQYAVYVDTIPPTIQPLSIKSNTTLTESSRIRFKISDDLAGIKTIKGTLDGKWALFEYDAKNNLITHKFDNKRFEFNKEHLLVLTVTDYYGNQTTYKATFSR